MKKKFAALLIAFVLLTSFACNAFASTSWTTLLMSNLDSSLTAEVLTGSKEIRSATAASMIIELVLKENNVDYLGSNLSIVTNSYIAQYGTCIDLYFALNDGTYYNLFYSPATGEMTDYGISYSKPSSKDYTYYTIDGADLLTGLTQVIDALSN